MRRRGPHWGPVTGRDSRGPRPNSVQNYRRPHTHGPTVKRITDLHQVALFISPRSAAEMRASAVLLSLSGPLLCSAQPPPISPLSTTCGYSTMGSTWDLSSMTILNGGMYSVADVHDPATQFTFNFCGVYTPRADARERSSLTPPPSQLTLRILVQRRASMRRAIGQRICRRQSRGKIRGRRPDAALRAMRPADLHVAAGVFR